MKTIVFLTEKENAKARLSKTKHFNVKQNMAPYKLRTLHRMVTKAGIPTY